MSFVAVKAAKNRAPLKCKSGQRFSFKRFQSAAFHLSHNSVATLVPITKSDDFGNFTNRGTIIQSSWGMCPLTREYKYNKFFFYQNIRSQIPPFPPGLFLMNCFVLLGEGAARFGGYRWVSPPLKSLCTGNTTFFSSPNVLPTDLRKQGKCIKVLLRLSFGNTHNGPGLCFGSLLMKTSPPGMWDW